MSWADVSGFTIRPFIAARIRDIAVCVTGELPRDLRRNTYPRSAISRTPRRRSEGCPARYPSTPSIRRARYGGRNGATILSAGDQNGWVVATDESSAPLRTWLER